MLMRSRALCLIMFCKLLVNLVVVRDQLGLTSQQPQRPQGLASGQTNKLASMSEEDGGYTRLGVSTDDDERLISNQAPSAFRFVISKKNQLNRSQRVPDDTNTHTRKRLKCTT